MNYKFLDLNGLGSLIEKLKTIFASSTQGNHADSAYQHSLLKSGNPHNVTKSDIGLGNVGNFKAVSTIASQGLTTTEKSNARANIGAGTSNFSGSYTDLTNKPTIPTVGNGTITITQNGSTKGSFTMNQSGNATIALTDNNTTYSQATSSNLGLVKIGYAENGKNYPVELSNGQMFVNVPWTDTNTTYGLASTTANGLLKQLSGSTSQFMRGDGSWATPPNTNTTYTLTKSGSTITLTGSDGKTTSVTDSNTTYSLSSFGITATAAELNYCDGVTSNIQTQLNGKAPTSHGTHVPSVCTTITDWNSATSNGWYMASSASNAPASGWFFGYVIAHNTKYVFQEVYAFTQSTDAKAIDKYIRAKMNGTWGGWTNVTVGKEVPTNAVFTDTKYTLPTASSSTLGGVKTTSSVTSTSGLTACPIISGVPYYKDTNTTYSLSSFGITATAAELNKLDGCTATVTELNYVDGVTSNIQTQLNGKAPTSHNHSASNITSGTLPIARGGTGGTSASTARANIDAINILVQNSQPTSQNVGDFWLEII